MAPHHEVFLGGPVPMQTRLYAVVLAGFANWAGRRVVRELAAVVSRRRSRHADPAPSVGGRPGPAALDAGLVPDLSALLADPAVFETSS